MSGEVGCGRILDGRVLVGKRCIDINEYLLLGPHQPFLIILMRSSLGRGSLTVILQQDSVGNMFRGRADRVNDQLQVLAKNSPERFKRCFYNGLRGRG